jgi:AP-1-like factor
MAGTSTNDFPTGAPFYLDPNQQDLLLAALASNTQDPNALYSNTDNTKAMNNNSQFPYPVDTGFDPTYFASPQQSTPANAFAGSITESPYVDYLDGDNNFDFDGDNGDLMIGALPGTNPDDGTEKRSRPDDDADDAEGGGKRREGEENKQAKKPGRKPLTSEPTTVRFFRASRFRKCC